jgi:hypothetical protein
MLITGWTAAGKQIGKRIGQDFVLADAAANSSSPVA